MDDGNTFSLKEMQERNTQQVESSDGNVNSSFIFDNLCAGLLTSLHLVQSSVDELLSLKDELLRQQALPPVVLSKIALCSTKVFRSVGDCWTPANELTRLVQLYSMPWEEKNKAYKKLYNNFESKKSQLNIAIRRLQLLEAQAHRLEHENKVKKWENMFVKITSAKGHKRRWRFLTAWFNSKAQQGPRALQKFVRHMAKVVDSEGEEEEEQDEEEQEKKDDRDRKLIREILPHEPLNVDAREFDLEDMEREKEVDKLEDVPQGERLVDDNEETKKKRISTPKVELFHRRSVPSRTRQVMIDQESWTHEPEFDLYLCVRIFRPEELGQQDLTCHVHFDDQVITTEFPGNGVHSEGALPPPKAAGGGRRLVGSRNGDAANGSVNSKALEIQQSSYEDCVFCLPAENFPGRLTTNRQLNFEIYNARSNRLLATAIVDMDDLTTMDLPTLVIPPPEGDTAPPGDRERSISTDSPPLKHSAEKTIPQIELHDRLKSVKSTSFPLFAVGSESMKQEVCGRLPLVCIWAKQEKPRTFNRATESESLVEIVRDLTGFDLTTVTKEDLHRETETQDRATSPAAETDSDRVLMETETETIARLEYEKVVRGHVEEIQIMRMEYESRLQEMSDSLQEMEEAHSDMQRLIQTNAESSLASASDERSRPGPRRSEKRSRSPSKLDLFSRDQHAPQPPRDGRSPRQATISSGARLTRSATTSSSDVPQNFYDRLKHFKDRSQKHKQELAERTKMEGSENIERRLAGSYKLSAEDPDANSVQDVNLPAVFMPTKNRDLNMYNPRAHRYFHATGAHGLRLTQPPSILELPPISNSTIPVINLFEVSQNFQQASDSGSWLMQRLNQQPNSNSAKTNISGDPVPLESKPVTEQMPHHSEGQREDAADE